MKFHFYGVKSIFRFYSNSNKISIFKTFYRIKIILHNFSDTWQYSVFFVVSFSVNKEKFLTWFRNIPMSGRDAISSEAGRLGSFGGKLSQKLLFWVAHCPLLSSFHKKNLEKQRRVAIEIVAPYFTIKIWPLRYRISWKSAFKRISFIYSYFHTPLKREMPWSFVPMAW